MEDMTLFIDERGDIRAATHKNCFTGGIKAQGIVVRLHFGSNWINAYSVRSLMYIMFIGQICHLNKA